MLALVFNKKININDCVYHDLKDHFVNVTTDLIESRLAEEGIVDTTNLNTKDLENAVNDVLCEEATACRELDVESRNLIAEFSKKFGIPRKVLREALI